MFKRNTVFVLGAGASCHYGYPTGQELVEKVAATADRIASYCDNRLNTEALSLNRFLPKYIQQKMHGKVEISSAYRQAWLDAKDECQLLTKDLERLR